MGTVDRTSNDQLRRNIWRSLLILKSAAISELPSVVSGLSVRKGRSLLRELEIHGYVAKVYQLKRQVYSQAIDSPSLPPVCQNCGRPFSAKACSKNQKRQTETDRETQTKAQRQRNKKAAIKEGAKLIKDRLENEVTHDAA